MTELRRLAASVLMPGFVGTTVPDWLERELAGGLAGVCLFGHNIAGSEQVRLLTDRLHAARRGVLVASDEEGGTVTRLEAEAGSSWPGHAALGALDDTDATRAVAAGIGALVRGAGVDLALAPVVDVNSEPDNPVIGVRSFGAGPELVSRHGAAFVAGLQGAGVAACAKHFPGHGATRTDSHLALPVVDAPAEVFRSRDLAPFTAAVTAGVRCVMTAHVLVPALDDRPAMMSPVLLRMLREELGFTGVVVTDALDMRAVSHGVGRATGAVRALAAGADLLCVGNPVFPDPYDDAAAVRELLDAIVAAVGTGDLPVDRLEEASHRVAALAAEVADRPATAPVAGCDGVEVARRALEVHGDVTLTGEALVLDAQTPVGIAAGQRESALLTRLRQLRPEWEVAVVRDADQARAAVAGAGDRAVLLLAEGRPDATTRACLEQALAVRPDAVVVHGGPAGTSDHGERRVHTYGGGRATAEAVAGLVLEGARA
ncbi:MAG TPA: glycoside hydrolase family 3 N-terminal domain-containing protein [Nocardioidaceae bacterium]|nr:glycoside hydrolase family 3 N-terminal domain-containing protein [Nocardioidaceae bacterium]